MDAKWMLFSIGLNLILFIAVVNQAVTIRSLADELDDARQRIRRLAAVTYGSEEPGSCLPALAMIFIALVVIATALSP
jgi:hypothetical protein